MLLGRLIILIVTGMWRCLYMLCPASIDTESNLLCCSYALKVIITKKDLGKVYPRKESKPNISRNRLVPPNILLATSSCKH